MGGTITAHGQCISPGSFLVLESDGRAAISVPLTPSVAGQWDAVFDFSSSSLAPRTRVLSARVVQGTAAFATIDQQIEITATGFATDAPSPMPPAAPVPQFQSNPISGVGIVIKRHPPYPKGSHGKIVGQEKCDDGGLTPSDGSSALINGCLSKKGYEYYSAKSDLGAAGLQNNPAFVESNSAGNMPSTHSSRPAPSGLPGEVSFQASDLVLACPAGPQLAWTRTYRSMKPVSSGHGPQWDFSYNIRIEALPSTAGSTAPKLVLYDGGG